MTGNISDLAPIKLKAEDIPTGGISACKPPICEGSRIEIAVHKEHAKNNLRYLIKKDGTCVLQQLVLVRGNISKQLREEWRDIEEVEE